MALVLKDRVKETTTTTGTGTVTLAGAVTDFQSFSVIGNGNTTYYTIVNQNANEWEVGIGTYTASGTTLSRDTVLESSNAGALVNFSAGIKDVFVTYPAERAVYTDGVGSVITPATASALAIVSGGTGATSASDARTNLGATTLGSNLFTVTNPSAITFPRFNADNSVSSLSASDFRTAIGAGTGNGTVTSVAATAGTGISVTGSPITSSGTLTITNTAPDQTVSLTAGTGISVSGTYPSFTITNTSTATGNVSGPASSTDNAIARYDGTTGKLIQNSAVTIDDTTGSMTFTSTNSGTRFRADMSAATDANRFAFQSSVANGSTSLQVIPNGTSTTSSLKVSNNSSFAASSFLQLLSTSSVNYLNSSIDGTGTYLPIAFNTNENERLRITINGGLSFGATGTAYGTSGQVLTSNGDAPPSWTTLTAGDVSGPASSTDNAITRFDGTTGKLIQGSVATVDDSGNFNINSGQLRLQPGASTSSIRTDSNISLSLRTGTTANQGIEISGTNNNVTFYNRVLFASAIDETVFAVSGTTPALSPSNGTIQTWTLSGNSTPTQGTWNEGESLTLMINDGNAFTVTWTSIPVTWVGGTAPTLATSGFTVIELWKVGTTVYGALVGSVA